VCVLVALCPLEVYRLLLVIFVLLASGHHKGDTAESDRKLFC